MNIFQSVSASKNMLLLIGLGAAVGVHITLSFGMLFFTPYVTLTYQLSFCLLPLIIIGLVVWTGIIKLSKAADMSLAIIFVLAYAIVINAAFFGASKRAMKSDFASFKKDPDGFVFIKKYAADNFQTRLLLNEDIDSYWMDFALGHNPAAIMPSKGNCPLFVLPKKILNYFDPSPEILSNPELSKAWVKGVLVHELGHCVDIYRDYPSSFTADDFQLNAIHPVVRGSIKSFDDYSDAEMNNVVSNWREAFADIMAIGFWKLNFPSHSELLAKSLLDVRENRRDTDANKNTHDTVCWINHVKALAPPISDHELLLWTDKARQDALQCLRIH